LRGKPGRALLQGAERYNTARKMSKKDLKGVREKRRWFS